MHTPSATAAAVLVAALLATSGCAVTRGQQTPGAYLDDAAITATVKGKFADSKDINVSAISVETLNGTVMLSGFATSAKEKATAETLARQVKGVTSVKNGIAVQP